MIGFSLYGGTPLEERETSEVLCMAGMIRWPLEERQETCAGFWGCVKEAERLGLDQQNEVFFNSTLSRRQTPG